MEKWSDPDGLVTLYRADCLDVLPTLAAGSVSAVVTDPPYGVEFDYLNGADDSEKEYAGIVGRVLMSERTLKPGGFLAVYQAAKHATRWAEWFPRDWKLLALPKNFVQGGRGELVPSTDYVLWWPVGKGLHPRLWQRGMARDWFLCDTSPARRDAMSKGHPCPRPPDGVRYVAASLCPPRGTVLDPFMGSGTTGVACVQTGRQFIGVEIDPGYFEIAKLRIQEALDATPLFTLAERQEQLFA